MPSDNKPRGENRATQIQRISRAGVNTGRCQLLILAQLPRTSCPNEQSEGGDTRSDCNPMARRRRQEPIDHRHGIADTHPPAHPKFSRLAHKRNPTECSVTLTMTSTAVESMAAE